MDHACLRSGYADWTFQRYSSRLRIRIVVPMPGILALPAMHWIQDRNIDKEKGRRFGWRIGVLSRIGI